MVFLLLEISNYTIIILCNTLKLFIRLIVESILEDLMTVLPDIFMETSDVDNEHLPANSVSYTIILILIIVEKE